MIIQCFLFITIIRCDYLELTIGETQYVLQCIIATHALDEYVTN